MKVCAGNASALKPWPCGLLTREKAAYGWLVGLFSKVYRKPNWLPSGRSEQISRKLPKTRALSGARVKDGQTSGSTCEVPSPGKYFGMMVIVVSGSGLRKTNRCANEAESTTSGNTWMVW